MPEGSPGLSADPLGSLEGTLELSQLESTPDLGVLLTLVVHHETQAPGLPLRGPAQVLTRSCIALQSCKREISQGEQVKPPSLSSDLPSPWGQVCVWVQGRLPKSLGSR